MQVSKSNVVIIVTAVILGVICGFGILYAVVGVVSEPKVVTKVKEVLILCVDGECFDDKKYITDQNTLVEAMEKYGHPGWMTELKYDPDATWEESEPKWEDDIDR